VGFHELQNSGSIQSFRGEGIVHSTNIRHVLEQITTLPFKIGENGSHIKSMVAVAEVHGGVEENYSKADNKKIDSKMREERMENQSYFPVSSLSSLAPFLGSVYILGLSLAHPLSLFRKQLWV
jgi:hypothetical protein